jgi:phosphohistidine phosphatase
VVSDGTLSLYLVRHAFAGHADASRWPDDARRPLTADGIRRFRTAALGLRAIAPDVDVVLSSGFTRAWDTAALLHEVTGWPEPRPAPALEAGKPVEPALELLRGHEGESVALVGHEPFLSRLASILCAGREDALRLELKKGAVALLRVERPPGPGSAALRWAVSPRILYSVDGVSP